MTLHLFGDLRLDTGSSVIAVTAPTHRRLLTRIAVASGSTISVGRLIDALWGDDPPARPKESLQSHVHRIRRILGPHVIASTSAGYRLDTARVATDLDELTAFARHAVDEPDDRDFLARFEAGAELMSHEPFAGLSDEPWAIPLVARVAEERAIIAERRVRSLVAVDRAAEAVVAAEHLAVIDPSRESSAVVLVDALSHAGRVADAMRVATEFRAAHVERTGLGPSSNLARAERRALAADLDNDHARSNFPVPGTPCIGRVRELAAIVELLRVDRIVTVWGPGGIGKTRLALAVAERLATEFLVVFADLSEITEGDRVIQLIAEASGIGSDASVDAVARHLGDRATLVLLDTAEHVVPAVAQVVRKLVARCRELRVLVTSRERLDVPGEITFSVPPLGPAGPQLFAHRAKAAGRAIQLDASTEPIVSAICDRVDGLPLAIELAAAQVAWRSLPSILDALAAPFDALHGPDASDARGKSLGATIDWSWRLLGDRERVLLGRVSAFAGAFRLDAAQAVSDDEPVVAHRLAALVRKSMVSVIEDHEPEVRYRLLDTVRSFVRSRVASTGDDAETQAAIIRWAETELDRILTHTRAGNDETAAVLRKRHGANIAGALDIAIGRGLTDEVMRCIPAIAEIGWQAMVGSANRVATLAGWEQHPAAPYLWLLWALDLHDVDRVRTASAVVEAAELAPHLCARVRAATVMAASLVGADHIEDLVQLRRIAATDDDSRTAWAHAFGEAWALPIGDPSAGAWSRRAAAIARAASRPAAAAISDYMAMQLCTGPEHATEYRSLRAAFLRFGMSFYADRCSAALDYADPGSRTISWWLGETRSAVRASPGMVRHFGEHRAHLLASHGATAAAATVFGGLDRLRAEGLDVTPFGSQDARARIVASNAEAYGRGQTFLLSELAAVVVDELGRLSGP